MLTEKQQFRIQTWNAYLQSFIRCRSDQKFMVFAQGRTGSWLLRDLLNSHPRVHADKEVLQWPIQFPKRALLGLSSSYNTRVYGCHVQIKQIRDVQGKNVAEFLSYLHQQDWKIIYLRRNNYLRQSVSSMLAVQRRLWKSSQTEHLNSDGVEHKYTLDCSALLRWLNKRQIYRKQEQLALSGLPFLELVYEHDLRGCDQHQKTAERIFDYLGLDSVTVKSSLKRLGSNNLVEQIENYEEVVAMLESSQQMHFLDQI
jgi:LPS sulfotransferase NodH